MARGIKILPRKRRTLGSFSRTHKRNTMKQRQIRFTNFQNGFIVKIDYYGKWTKKYKTSHYLVIEPRYDNYVHVFDIDFIPSSVLQYMVSLTIDRKPDEFIFANQSFSFLNFKQSKKPLYRMLYPIMRKSYRKLIRNSDYIRRSYLIDYNFSKTRQLEQPVYVTPNLGKEQSALEDFAEKFELDTTKLIESSKNGLMRTLTPAIWSNIKNTDSWDFDLTLKAVRQLSLDKRRDIEVIEKQIQRMKLNHAVEAPIVVQLAKNEYYCVGGESRLLIAMALRTTPKVYLFKYEE